MPILIEKKLPLEAGFNRSNPKISESKPEARATMIGEGDYPCLFVIYWLGISSINMDLDSFFLISFLDCCKNGTRGNGTGHLIPFPDWVPLRLLRMKAMIWTIWTVH